MTIQNFLNTYDFPTEEIALINDAVAYWENKHPGQTVTISVTKKGSGVEYLPLTLSENLSLFSNFHSWSAEANPTISIIEV